MPPAPVRFSDKAGRTTDSPISYFIQQAVENPNIISLAAGLVDPLSLPGREVATAAAELLAQPARAQAALQYGTTHGYAPLRAKLLARACALDGIAPQDISVDPDDIVVTTGSQQLLYLITELLLNPGDLVIAEAPSYFVYQGTLTSAGLRTLTVPIDEDGLNTDALESLLGQLERSGELDRLKLIYVVDYFQNPTGLSLSLPRRQRLVELVKRFSRKQRIFILEDAAYRELRFDGPDLPSIKSFDRDNEYVILGMTFSKPCAPGLKTGYGLMPRELVAPLLHIKGNHDFGSNNLTQHLLDRLLESGDYDRQVSKLRDVYRGKRDALLAVLDHEFADGSVRRTHPQGGLYVWLTFPPEVQTGPQSPLMKAALCEGVIYVPGEFCYINGANGPIPTNEARLSFGVASVEQIREAVRRLGRAYRSAISGKETVATIR
jgi:2-aminoadipate transaminase